MSQKFEQTPETAIAQSGIARVIPCKELDLSDPLKWLALGLNDLLRAPLLTAFFGVIFAAIPWAIQYLVVNSMVTTSGLDHLLILPAMVCFMLLGPFLAAGLYDVSWELEKGRKPSLWHSIKAVKRNAVNEWAFGIMLMVLMIFWLRVASMIHALYPQYNTDSLEAYLPFLTLGTLAGAGLTMVVFFISAFTQPVLMERKVDLATAVLTSINAVWLNKVPMMIWAGIICLTVAIGFFTGFLSFIVLMPLIGYASWHAYIDTIETKRERKYV